MRSAFLGLLLTPALALAEDSPTFKLARSYAERGADPKAIPLLEKVVKDEPKNAEAHVLLGMAYARQDRRPDAEAEVKLALAADPKRYDAYLVLGMLRDLANDPAGAVAVYQQAMAVDPARPEAYREAGSSELLTGQPAQAAEHLLHAHQLLPRDLDIALDLGQAQVQAKQCERAEKLVGSLLGQGLKSAPVYVLQGDALACQGKDEPDAAAYTTATTIDPQSGQAWFHLGLLQAKRNQLDAAKAALGQAGALSPKDPEVQAALQKYGVAAPTARKPIGPVKPAP